MSILHVTTGRGPGGLEVVVKQLAKDQIKRSRKVGVYAYDHRETIDIFEQTVIPVVDTKPKRKGLDIRTIRKLRKLANDYHILHCHDIGPMIRCAYLKLINKLSLNPRKNRIIYTVHGLSNHHLVKHRFYEKIAPHLVDHIVAVSEEVYHWYYTRGFRSPKLKLIHNGVKSHKTPRFPSNSRKALIRSSLLGPYDIPQDAPIWINVSRIVPLKNQETLIRGAYKNHNAHLLLVGDVTNISYHTKLKDIDPDNRVHFLNYRSDIDNLLDASDVYVSASLKEGCPLSVLEAMSRGLPCVLSDIEGHRTLALKGCTTLASFFDPGSGSHLNDEINRLLSDEDTLKERSIDAHQHVREHYSLEKMMSQYRDLYDMLLTI